MRGEMPVAVKFSEKFYKRFGHELTDELVSYLNQIDTSYRSELRELNELNYARFDAKLEQRVAELRAEFKQGIAELRTELMQEIAGLRAETKQEIAALRSDIKQEIAALRLEVKQDTATLRGDLRAEFHQAQASLETKLIRWMFVFWAGSTFTILGTMLALLKG